MEGALLSKKGGGGCEGARGVKKFSLRIQIENIFFLFFFLGGWGGGVVGG